MVELAVAFATDPRQVFLATVIALGEVKQERDTALARVAELETQRDNLQRCNNDYLGRIRKAEAPPTWPTYGRETNPYGSGGLVHGDGF